MISLDRTKKLGMNPYSFLLWYKYIIMINFLIYFNKVWKFKWGNSSSHLQMKKMIITCLLNIK
jgi:hypothetical protein